MIVDLPPSRTERRAQEEQVSPKKRLVDHGADDDSEFLTVREVASRLRVSAMTVYRLLDNRQLVAHRIGKQFRVSRDALQDFLEGQLQTDDEE
jgi:excisionase family DNA binding protein